MIHGSEELERKLEALEGIADQHMERLVRNQIKRIQAEAKLLCPVEGGELRDSIRTMGRRCDRWSRLHQQGVCGICGDGNRS